MIQILIIDLLLLFITFILIKVENLLYPSKKCKITVNKEKIFEVDIGGSLLNYLTENKLFIPSACGGKATCGFCKVKVLSGGGDLLPTEEVFISRSEKMAGVRLACQVKVKSDIEILIPEHLLGAKEFKGKVLEKSPLTHDIKHIVIKLIEPKEIEFKPGQYIQIKVPGTDEFRAYSIASSPYQKDFIELIVRLVPGGLCSTYIHEVMEIGDEVNFTGPFGDFYLREESKRDIIAIGGGCGMAPIRSILLYLIENGLPRKFIFFFGARSKRDLFYTEELREIEKKFPNFKYIPALSEPRKDDKWEGETGLITEVVDRYIENAENFEAYLCGPPPMIDAAIKVLTKKGMDINLIYYDKF
ncbi:MAG: NADH:ubiquinone reductase (Na(+)-transporting) subunit F [Candidatus Ratteibacteria bacterium]